MRVTLLDTTMETDTVKSFLFEADSDLSYQPGQHMVFTLDDDGDDVERPYTMTNLPCDDRFTVAVKRYDDGHGSVLMHSLSRGDTVEISEPKGNLRLQDYNDDAVFISTGTGASPMLAMLKAYLRDGDGHAYYLHGEKTTSSRIFTEQLLELQAEHDNLTVVFSLSDEDWDGRTGFIQNHVDDVVDNPDTCHHYACGVPAMVVDTKQHLQDLGVDDERIHAEGWEDSVVDE